MANVGDFDYVPCAECAGVGGGSSPTVSNVTPAVGTDLRAFSVIEFDVTDVDSAFRRIIIYIAYPNTGEVEAVYTGDEFCPYYINSSRINIANGYHFKITRSKAWPDKNIKMTIDAIDVTGLEN